MLKVMLRHVKSHVKTATDMHCWWNVTAVQQTRKSKQFQTATWFVDQQKSKTNSNFDVKVHERNFPYNLNTFTLLSTSGKMYTMPEFTIQ